jgi:predicted NBD/HSP70 family sugar kinase
LASVSGLSRKVVTQRVQQAIDLGFLENGGLAPSEGGRQANTLRFVPDRGCILTAAIGVSEFTTAIADLNGTILRTSHEDWRMSQGADATMERITLHFETFLSEAGSSRPWAVCVGAPGPVDFPNGRLGAPPLLPSWSGYGLRAWFRDRFDAPVWVDNDVNLMALGEQAGSESEVADSSLFIDIGEGIASALTANGRLTRGASGAAGDIGHLRVAAAQGTLCRCGKRGCLETVAGGWHMLELITARAAESPFFAERLSSRGHLVLGDIAEAADHDDPLALSLLESSAEQIGLVIANLVTFADPGEVVIGGGALRAGSRFLSIVDKVVRENTLDSVNTSLVIRSATVHQREGVTGAARLAADRLFSPANLALWVADGSPHGRSTQLQRSGLTTV